MNVRIDDTLRIRLAKEDYQKALQNGCFWQQFNIGSLYSFEVEILVSVTQSLSEVRYESNKVQIILSKVDANNLAAEKTAKTGLHLPGITVQVDLFS